jgi:DNA-binding FadR family transcriptional regulator
LSKQREAREGDKLKRAAGKKIDLVPRPATGRLSDRVYDHVLGQMVVGIFPINCRLPPENKLAAHLDVSRPVVREALMRLREDGLIESRQGAGWSVVRRPAAHVYDFAPLTSIADIQRCFVFRVALEGEIAALAARHHDADSLRRIEKVLKALDDIVAYQPQNTLGAEEDMLFHRTIAEATGNRFFVETLVSLQSQIAIGINLNRNLTLIQPGRVAVGQREHHAVFDAIVVRNEKRARQKMRDHIENARKRVFEAG